MIHGKETKMAEISQTIVIKILNMDLGNAIKRQRQEAMPPGAFPSCHSPR